MAIDTRDKRSSAIHVGLPWRGMLPLPDGAVGQEDRQHAATFYAGVLAAAPAVVAVAGGWARAGWGYLASAFKGRGYSGGAKAGQGYLGGGVR